MSTGRYSHVRITSRESRQGKERLSLVVDAILGVLGIQRRIHRKDKGEREDGNKSLALLSRLQLESGIG
jgi:hypothetical protein